MDLSASDAVDGSSNGTWRLSDAHIVRIIGEQRLDVARRDAVALHHRADDRLLEKLGKPRLAPAEEHRSSVFLWHDDARA